MQGKIARENILCLYKDGIHLTVPRSEAGSGGAGLMFD